MTAERWQQIESLYHSALEHPFAERRVFVAGICNGDGELQREIESLLASQETAGDFIEEPITGAAARVLSIQQTRMLISREISHYKILSLLGAGGMGEVYLAEDTALYRKVALKLFHSHLARDNEIHERFMREARLAASLDHPNICTVYEVGETEGRPFIAMRHVQGKTLKDLIAGQPLALESLFSISLQVADALAAAHSRGIIHRDIKAENIMVASDGRVQVLDFGIAKLLEKEEQDTRLTTGGRAMGTPAVMSPEQARGERVDARTDIFSFGVVIYEMATGRLPFIGKSQADIISALLKERQTPAAKINTKITRQLSAEIDRALEKEPDRRHCSMEAMISALQEAKTDSHGDHRLGATIFHRVHKGLATAILVTVAVVAAGVMYYFWPQHGASHVRSIAILPFKPLTADSRNESLEMGMADTLITRLSNLRQLAVRPMSSVRRYAAAEQDPIAAGREQRVDAVLDGSIQKSGERIRVTVRLISLTDGHQLWADKFEEQFRDIFSVEDSISERVAAALTPTLSRQEKKELAKHYTDNPEAHELYLKGRFFWNKRTPDNFQNAISYFQRAVDKDPNYALAYSGLADAYCLLGPYGGSPPNETMPKAKAAALKALELDDNLAEAHASLALILDYYDWDYSGALREFDRAIQLNPNYATAHQWRGEFLMALARHDEAIGEIRHALELDPLSLIINRVLGDAYYFARRYDEAVDQFRKTIDMDPNFPTAHWFLAAAYECKGMYQDAVVEWTKEVELGGDKEEAAAMRQAYAMGGWNGYCQYVLASLKESASQKFVPPSRIARACAEVGEKDEAFAWLQKAYQERDYEMTLLKVNPSFDSLRSDPRFNDLLRRVNLASASARNVAPSASALTPLPEKSIAVLPLENLSDDPDNAYFAEGMQDEILARLSKIADLKVISRTSTQKYKNAPDNLREIAKQLGVGNVLEGSVQKSGDAVRVNVQLINALNDAHLWGDVYDRKLTDIFAVESDIAKTIADTLQAKLTGAEKQLIAAQPTTDLTAYELYLKGYSLWSKRGGENLRQAIGFYEQAIARDPKYALAYAGLAEAYVLLPFYTATAPKDAYPTAKAAALKALQLDEKLAEAHTALGLVLCIGDLDMAGSISEFQRAIALNPNYATAHHWYGNGPLLALGRFEEAIAEGKRAIELDPLSPIINADLGQNLYNARRYDEAIAQLRKTLEIDPTFNYAHFNLGIALQLKGDVPAAIAEYTKAQQLSDDLFVQVLLAAAKAQSGNKDAAIQMLAELEELSQHRYVPPYLRIGLYLSLGNRDEAIRRLDQAISDHESLTVILIKVDPMLDPLRGDPRFEALVQKVVGAEHK